MTSVIPYRFLVRGGTAAALAARNEVPLSRELIIERDTLCSKLGDGLTSYNDLPYMTGRGQIGFGVSNESGPISGGTKRVVRLTHGLAVRSWSIAADVVGGATVHLWASDTYAPSVGDDITSGAPPQLVAESNASGTAEGWVAPLPAGTWLLFFIEPGATVSRLDLTLETIRTPD